jgi:hypothetical protein
MSTVRNARGFTYHSASSAGLEETAAAIWLKSSRIAPGIAFNRKRVGVDSEKYLQRQAVLDLYSPPIWLKHLSILVMPAQRWPFEKVLLARRFRENLTTDIWAVEQNAGIFRAALAWIPGRKRWHRGEYQQNGGIRFLNNNVVSTRLISSYEFCEVEEFITRESCHVFDTAWLDFTGFLTERRVQAIAHFWERSVSHSITVTSLAARWDKKTSSAIRAAGGIPEYLQKLLPHSRCLQASSYAEPSPMIQVTLAKEQSK